jgi:hypothetical protein
MTSQPCWIGDCGHMCTASLKQVRGPYLSVYADELLEFVL